MKDNKLVLQFIFFIVSVSQLMDRTQECLFLVHVIRLHDCGILVLQVEQCVRFMVMRVMLTPWSSFQMAIGLELDQMMELADCLTSELVTNCKYTISSTVIMRFLMWPPLHSPYLEDFSLLDTQMEIAMYGTLYWQRYKTQPSPCPLFLFPLLLHLSSPLTPELELFLNIFIKLFSARRFNSFLNLVMFCFGSHIGLGITFLFVPIHNGVSLLITIGDSQAFLLHRLSHAFVGFDTGLNCNGIALHMVLLCWFRCFINTLAESIKSVIEFPTFLQVKYGVCWNAPYEVSNVVSYRS